MFVNINVVLVVVGEALSLEHESLEDFGRNAALYIFNHEVAQK